MTQNFPVFVDGQTLTHTELNELRDYLDAKDHSLGQLIGFGIGCGLEVTLDGATYVVSPGLAIDQLGRPIVVTEPMKITVDAAAVEFDWLDGDRRGQTVVLTLEEVVEDAPDCEEDGCSRHAAPATRRPVLRVATGCVEPSSFSVETSELAGINPIVVTKRSIPSNRGVTMKSRMMQILQSRRFSTEARSRLDRVSIGTTEIPGARAYKAGFLNQVFFALIEFLRCEALTTSACFRPTETPGVALGCAVDGRWDCEPAHHWEPSSGLARSLLGSGCEDPCRFHRARIEALILGFVLPDFPEPDDPPRPTPGGPFHICRHPKLSIGVGNELTMLRNCYHVEIPPFDSPDILVFDRDPDIAFDPTTDIYPVDELYDRVKDPIDAGTITIAGGLGHDVVMVQQGIAEAIVDSEGSTFQFDVMVVDEAEVADLAGYQPAADAAITDQIVLVANDAGMVTATGRVPINGTLNGVGPAVREVSDQATTAVASVNELAGDVVELGGRVATIGLAAEDLSTTILGADGQVGLADRFGLLEEEVADFGQAVGSNQLTAELTALSATLSQQFSEKTNELEILIATGDRTVRQQFDEVSSDLRQEMSAGQNTLRAEFAADTSALKGDLTALETGLRGEMVAGDNGIRGDLNLVQTELRRDLNESQSNLWSQVQDQIRTTGSRIDDVLVGRRLATDGPVLERLATNDLRVIETFRAMAEVLESQLADGGGESGRKALRNVDRAVTRLEAAAQMGADLPRVAGDEIVAAFENLSAVVSDMGASTSALRPVTTSITRLRRELQQ